MNGDTGTSEKIMELQKQLAELTNDKNEKESKLDSLISNNQQLAR